MTAGIENHEGRAVRLGGKTITLAQPLGKPGDDGKVSLALRPEAVSLHPTGNSDVAIDGRVINVSFLGSVIRTRLDVEGQTMSFDTFNNPGLKPPAIGDTVTAHFKSSDVLVIPG